ncbi:EcsC family protein [Ureibacillus sp. 179-F W5.1 NHS]|uniref:EcsC family protein n=1 Tax=Lysinibacillus halotolerans TaxID=1368476 RepID=A0A3M8HG79_9BACI|nr:EcsC family protein [Lysinibacillus halotolerans]RND01379.1 EcsC family protein [Lysinibacillus halotolerans]
MESKEQLQTYLTEIEKWEEDQKGLFFWEKLGRLPFKLIDKLTPKFLQEKIGILVNELGSYIQTGGKYLISENGMIKKIKKSTTHPIETIDDIAKMPIQDMTQISHQLQSERSKLATVQGASTGFGGIFTLVIDIPLILGMALKTLQEIAIIHGYDPNEKQERVFIVKCLQFASADIVGKEAILKELANMHHSKNQGPESMISQLKGWQEVFFTYRDQFGWKKLLQMVPVAGMIFGAFVNKGMIEDVSETGMMLYRKRRINERLYELDQIESSSME